MSDPENIKKGVH